MRSKLSGGVPVHTAKLSRRSVRKISTSSDGSHSLCLRAATQRSCRVPSTSSAAVAERGGRVDALSHAAVKFTSDNGPRLEVGCHDMRNKVNPFPPPTPVGTPIVCHTRVNLHVGVQKLCHRYRLSGYTFTIGTSRSRSEAAGGDAVSSLGSTSRFGGPHRRVAGLLAGRMGQKQSALRGDGRACRGCPRRAVKNGGVSLPDSEPTIQAGHWLLARRKTPANPKGIAGVHGRSWKKRLL